jgi:demethylmenaquinone methyltransferase / 2-methoxy-6-polyprenyl-1,4-benzoquinol methylase
MIADAESTKARAVREMFASIAGRYDFLNHLLSGNVDRLWRRAFVREVEQRLPAPHPQILDVGCGTADLSLAFSRLGSVVGCDFCHPMLTLGKRKVAMARNAHQVRLLAADALSLPFPDSSFGVVVSAFVVRNLANLEKGLGEMRRVLGEGGLLGILDFSLPPVPVFGPLYRYYFTKILPKIGRLLSGVEGPYSYLPESVRNFPPPERLRQLIAAAGFTQVECRFLTGGIAVLFLGRRTAREDAKNLERPATDFVT